MEKLRLIEEQMQKQWEDEKVFEEDAPERRGASQDKFMVTFPYPYMNGRLHLGHAFTLLKCEVSLGDAAHLHIDKVTAPSPSIAVYTVLISVFEDVYSNCLCSA